MPMCAASEHREHDVLAIHVGRDLAVVKAQKLDGGIKKMDLRSYTKQELALLYFPDSDPDVA